MMRWLLITASLLATAAPAIANDSTATTGAGGLVLEKTDSIAMASEDLYVSVDQIRIKYVFRNLTGVPLERIVAFPMPARDLTTENFSDVAFPSNFRTSVEGKPVKATLERKAMANGRDQTALLEKLGIPVAPGSVSDLTRLMDKLPSAQKAQLIAAGLAGTEEWDDDGKGMKKHLIALWTVQDRYWWKQVFPAARNLKVEHSYIPGAGGSVGTVLAYRDLRGTEDGLRVKALYCADSTFIAALDRLKRDPKNDAGIPDRRIDYVLTTGSNWAKPIGDFRLVVDKGKPRNLVSFCETGIRKISPTQFEVRHRNWRPTRDLNVLIVEPLN